MRKQLGETNKQARDAAVRELAQFRGKNIPTLTPNEVKELLTIVVQLLGLADKDGNIK